MKIGNIFFEKSTKFSAKVEQLIASLRKDLTLISISGFISIENSGFISNLSMANLAINNNNYLVFLNLAKTNILSIKGYLDFLLEKELTYNMNFVELSKEATDISKSIQKLILESEN
ncbi:hypothetical protein [Polaribacter aestuariivivens]|uniref:hypothetical protein n=1 Tax=Polaribacter aestuariivivens TaxID=2304626 RepID=UPI003F490FCC